MKKIIKLAAIVLAGVACYYCGYAFLAAEGFIYFCLHILLFIGLLWYAPKLICGNKFRIQSFYELGMIAGLVWAIYIVATDKTRLNSISEFEQIEHFEFLLLDSVFLMLGSALMLLMVEQPKD